jgi:ubiquinone/menaquinone biosynthesis C-methylase UbiE
MKLNALLCEKFVNLESKVFDLLKPYISEIVSKNDPIGKKWIEQRRRGLVRLISAKLISQLLKRKRNRSFNEVQDHYERSYLPHEDKLGYFSPHGRYLTYTFSDKVMQMQVGGLFLVQAEIILQILKTVEADEICDVGCGIGAKLFSLAAQYPEGKFYGFDLSHNAIEDAKERQSASSIDIGLPPLFEKFTSDQIKNIRKINFFQSSATDISSIPNKYFDVIYTTAALEQMYSVLPEALKELRRITRRYAIFCEPFWESNGYLGRAYLFSANLFRQDAKYMEQHGFRKVANIKIPVKPTFAYSIMIAEVI